MSELPEYVLDRVFNAPRELVWRAWTDPELLSRWYGPGVETIIHEFDLRPGGMWLNEMKMGENSMLSKVVFKEVTPPELLVWHHHSSTDSNWETVSNPKMPDWPKILLTTVAFEEEGTKTKVRLTWVPFEASEDEIACFAGAVGNMGKGWEGGYAVIDQILSELQAQNG